MLTAKVLGKAARLLEHIARCSPEPVLPSDVSRACGIHSATASRLMGDLVSLGFLRQISRMQGYVLGPLAFALGQACGWEHHLAQVSRSAVAECARLLPCACLVAIRHGESRYVVCERNETGNPLCDVKGVCHRDLYSTATGRLLLAYASEEDVSSVVSVIGPPDARRWPDASGDCALRDALAAIRADGLSVKRDATYIAVSTPVFADGRFVAAFGAVVARGVGEGSFLARLRVAARDGALAITHALSSERAVG